LNLKQLILFGGATLLIAAIAGGLLLTSGDSGDEVATEDQAPRLGPGFVWIDGEWLSPSFIVETDASVIRINGRLVRRITRLESDAEAASNQPEGSLGELLEAAALRFDEMGGTNSEPPSEARLAELIQYVESLPGATAVSFKEPVLSITDETGQSGYVILQRPNPLTERQNVRTLQAVTTRWTASLRKGDALLFSGDVTLEIPANQAVDFLNALVAVFDLPEGEQQQAILDLIGEEQMATAMLAAGRPPKSLTDRLAPLTPPEPSLVTLSRQGSEESGPSASADGEYRTPASNKAYIFQPIEVEGPDWCFPDPLIQAALLQGYQVIHLRGKASTLDAAVASSQRAGIFYVCGHWHAMEPMATRADAMVKVAAYREDLGLADEDVYPIVSIHTRTVDRMPIPQFYIGAGSGFYEKLWRSAGSVVFLSQCHGADLSSGFDVPEFMAIEGQCFSVETERALETSFFAQLDGTGDNDLARTVGAAFGAILPGTGWILEGEGNTVLSPAVADYGPQQPVPAASSAPILGHVQFDTPMDQTVAAALDNIVQVKGCGAIITQRRWIDASTLEFEFTTGQDSDPEAVQDGPLRITVDAQWAASAGDPWLKLDGNQNPPDTEHVGPNKDDFVWVVDCTS
jgi:hypothetical protein